MKKTKRKHNDRLSPLSKALVLIVGLITIISMLMMPAGNMKSAGGRGEVSVNYKK